MKRTRSSVLGRFLDTVDRLDLLPAGSAVLVSISGGADSVALLDLVRTAAPGRRWRVCAFHLNHRLRVQADADERFVRSVARDMGIRLTVARVDVRRLARKRGVGLEEAGRTERYERLAAAAHRLGCDRVALGHTADDNLETVILNLCRGSGLRGLSGIPARRGLYVRPLIDIDRQSVRDYLSARGIGWVEDESNRDPRYRRNRVRADVLPVLYGLNPDVALTVRKAGERLADEDLFLEAQASEAARAASRPMRRFTLIDTVKLSAYDICLKRRMLRQLLPGLDASNTERILRLKPGGRLRLAARAFVRRAGRHIELILDKGA